MVLCPSLHVDFVICCKRTDSWLLLLSVYSFEKGKKKRQGMLVLNCSFSPFGLFHFCMYVIISDSWLKLLVSPVASLLMLCKHVKHWCCLHCVGVELQASSPLMLLVDVCGTQTISGCTGLAVLGSVSRFCLLQCALIWCVLVIAFLPSVVKDLQTITPWLAII